MGLTDASNGGFSVATGIYLALGAFFLYQICTVIYNIYFHPLAKIPGPPLWRATRLMYISSLLSGKLMYDAQSIHEKYGEVVRLAPNELSFAKEEAWRDIFEAHHGHKAFPKSPVLFAPSPGQGHSILTTADHDDHARMRKLMNLAFTKRALKAQQPIIERHADLFVDRLRTEAMAPGAQGKSVIVNIANWFSFFTFDVMGDLVFGESFNCLNDGAFHKWVHIIFTNIKALAFVSVIRYYPALESIVMSLIPKRLMQDAYDHIEIAEAKIHTRLNYEKPREDFMTPVIEHNHDFQLMSLKEIEATFSILTIAGSETSGTALAGIGNHLIQSAPVLAKLVTEIRSTFLEESDITIAAVKDLPYLNAVISEGLRMCNPVAAGLPRKVPQGGATVCGIWLPGQTFVSVATWTLSYSPAFFHNPDSFAPERWLAASNRPAEFESDHRSAIHPFGLGARSCIGQDVAWSEMRLVLARLVWAFDMEAGGGKLVDWKTLKNYFLVEKEPVLVRLTVRA
ncbi:hypothetical protein MMC30_005738 [Trapelia coarctata]|nr:hypothetical protein [Trapelia coarctata]